MKSQDEAAKDVLNRPEIVPTEAAATIATDVPVVAPTSADEDSGVMFGGFLEAELQ